MIARRIAAPLAALMISSALLAGAGPAFAARGENPDAEEAEAQAESEAEAEAEEQKVCPEELWTIPVQVEGLACVLLLAKDKPADEEKKDEPKAKKKNGNGNGN